MTGKLMLLSFQLASFPLLFFFFSSEPEFIGPVYAVWYSIRVYRKSRNNNINATGLLFRNFLISSCIHCGLLAEFPIIPQLYRGNSRSTPYSNDSTTMGFFFPGLLSLSITPSGDESSFLEPRIVYSLFRLQLTCNSCFSFLFFFFLKLYWP